MCLDISGRVNGRVYIRDGVQLRGGERLLDSDKESQGWTGGADHVRV